MRPNTDRLLEPQIGDIVHNFVKDEYFLIIDSGLWENIKTYDTICLNDGSIMEIGYWDYLYKTSWEIVA